MNVPRLLLRGLMLATALGSVLSTLAAAEAPKKLLMVTVTVGFRHSCIPLSEQIVAQLGKESGKFTVDYVRQPEGMPPAPSRPRAGKAGDKDATYQAALKKYEADLKAYEATWTPKIEAELKKLSPANLKKYDGVIFASTTGDLPLPDKEGFLEWIAAGGAFIGVHAATDTFHQSGKFAGYPPYVAMIGGAFRTHGPQVTVECRADDPSHAACKPLPGTWTVFDEIYEFKDYDRSKVHSLVSLDKHPQTKAPGAHPIAWNKAFGKGRVFYTSLGHREDVWDPNYKDPKAKDGSGRKNSPEVAKVFQQHLLGGILWTLGLAPASAELPK